MDVSCVVREVFTTSVLWGTGYTVDGSSFRPEEEAKSRDLFQWRGRCRGTVSPRDPGPLSRRQDGVRTLRPSLTLGAGGLPRGRIRCAWRADRLPGQESRHRRTRGRAVMTRHTVGRTESKEPTPHPKRGPSGASRRLSELLAVANNAATTRFGPHCPWVQECGTDEGRRGARPSKGKSFESEPFPPLSRAPTLLGSPRTADYWPRPCPTMGRIEPETSPVSAGDWTSWTSGTRLLGPGKGVGTGPSRPKITTEAQSRTPQGPCKGPAPRTSLRWETVVSVGRAGR